MDKQRSLFVTLVLIVVLTIVTAMFSYSTYIYIDTKKHFISDIKENSHIRARSLEKNLQYYIESYAVNEYEKIIENEMGYGELYAIIVYDYNMAKILAQETYISGKIRDKDWNIVEFNPNNTMYQKELESAFFVENIDILDSKDIKIGSLSIYTSDHYLQEKLYTIVLNSVFISIALSLVLIFFLYMVINAFVFKSLSKIIAFINNSDEAGIPKEHISQANTKEFSSLTNAMNTMIDSIKESRIDLKEKEAILEHQAHYDSLTNLPNRVLFQDRLEQGILKAKRDQTKLALFFIDLDDFKEINDSYGHEAGDELLKVISQRLKSTLRMNDTLARLGGDEFTIVIEEIVNIEDISHLADKVLKNLREPVLIENDVVYVSSSIGISLYPDDGFTTQELLKFADSAMYKAKDDGRNRFRFYSSYMTETAYKKVSMVTSLREAIKNEEFVVYYQPQVDARTDTIVGMEALVRWIHPERGIVSPVEFLSVAEATGLILEIDRWVMKTAMKQFKQWYSQGLEPGILAMNLAMKQLQDSNFINLFRSLMQETNCRSERLELEVTEGQIMKDPQRAINILNDLSSLGVDLAIDDFGTGYSSLAYLKKLPLDKLKIDKSFIDNVPHNEEDNVISKTIINLAENLKLKIIAEGVETKEQKDFLLENGCHYVQGYFYSKPIPAEEMSILLVEGFSKT